MDIDDLDYLSTGVIESCEECSELSDEPFFSWSECNNCGSTLGGDRYVVHGRDKDDKIIHLEVCTDCIIFLGGNL